MKASMTEPAAVDARLRADPLADDTVARILGAWDDGTPPVSRWEAVAQVERALAGWDSNAALAAWRAGDGMPAPIAAALDDYVQQARQLPEWCDAGKVGCAEAVFAALGTLSFTLLSCAAVPEADMAVTPFEEHPGERVRSAAALMCAALLPGGLLGPAGAGMAQVLKLRLKNALVRHLVVRGNPGEALTYGAAIPALLPEGADLYRTLFARGWDVRANGLPRNQEELAVALLSFQYVVPRSLRRLGLGLSKQDESAWLHAWNVVGHLLGVEQALLARSMKEAAALFARLQRHARAVARARYAAPGRKGAVPVYGKAPDPRPALAASLMRALQHEIRRRSLQAFPVLLARRLCDPATTRTLGLDGQVTRFARARFALGMGAARGVDTLARIVCPGLSLARLAARILGYRVALRLLADPARPPELPEAPLRQVEALLRDGAGDPAAPGWMNAIESRYRPAQAARGARQAAVLGTSA